MPDFERDESSSYTNTYLSCLAITCTKNIKYLAWAEIFSFQICPSVCFISEAALAKKILTMANYHCCVAKLRINNTFSQKQKV